MTLALMLQAMLVGVINAAPFGPVGLLCLKKNAEPDRWTGLCAALGMVLAYAIISFCVVFGLKTVGRFLEDHRMLLQIFAGTMLVIMGLRGMRTKPVVKVQEKGRTSRYLGDFSASFAMTLFNPVPFATFAIILTSLNIVSDKLDLMADFAFAASVAFGTMVFWLIVNQTLHIVKKRTPIDLCKWIAKGSAAAMIALGVVLAVMGIAW